MDTQSLYRQLGELASTVPPGLDDAAPLPPETQLWVARATALVHSFPEGAGFDVHVTSDKIGFSSAAESLGGILRKQSAHRITTLLFRFLARAELLAPAAARGAFIGVGADFVAAQTMSKVFAEAKVSVLAVDAYMDGSMMTDVVPLIPEGVHVRLLADPASSKVTPLRALVVAWIAQHGAARPLEVKLSVARALHDRLFIIDDGVKVWSLSQSVNHLAARSPATLSRLDDPDIAKPKAAYYMAMWPAAAAL